MYQNKISRLKEANRDYALEILKQDSIVSQLEQNRLQEAESEKIRKDEKLINDLRKNNAEYQQKLLHLEEQMRSKEKEFSLREYKICEAYEAPLEKLQLFKEEKKLQEQTEEYRVQLEIALEQRKLLEEKYYALKNLLNRETEKTESKQEILEPKQLDLTEEKDHLRTSVPGKFTTTDIHERNDQSPLFFTGNLKAEKMEQFVANEKQLVEICQETDLKLTELQKSVMRKQSIIEELQRKLSNAERKLLVKSTELRSLKKQNRELSAERKASRLKLLAADNAKQIRLQHMQVQIDKALQQIRSQRRNVQNVDYKGKEIKHLQSLIENRGTEMQSVNTPYKDAVKKVQKTMTAVERRLVNTNQHIGENRYWTLWLSSEAF
ncbi:unnamed protein product [Enterobius vermicularis]|uniref:Coiled-coil domain containing 146 n=1 Tax=Enterobius vermicularis TaxID=51028 RepID=A0A0N4UY60_ENTVE|nr:unnamed protein product [Enterobius vermicularis]